ncbi:MAG: hypothetical protein M5U15_10435 [Kiritimatiellae bacterium]|nr:hypothetical protein [Kiritimatiellia bacterium]
MMRHKNIRSRPIWAAALLALAVQLSAWAQNPYVILPNGTRVDGTEIRARSDGTITLMTPQGQVTYQRGQYQRAEAARPADFDRALRFAQARQYDEALTLLKKVIQEYRFLNWDNQARALAAQVELSKGDAAESVKSYEQLFQSAPDSRRDSAAMWGYMNALLGAKQFDKLDTQLGELIEKGTRTDAARAQVMRGDAKMAQGQVEPAVMDYLRSALLFDSEKTVLPEALFKAAEGLEKLRDPRSRDLYRRVAQEFAGTPYAQRAQGKF